MLEQLQRLQTHIGVLKTRLAHLENENSSLREEQDSSLSQHQAEIIQKNSIISQRQQENDSLTEQLAESRSQYQQLNNDATALADRYGRLEKSCTDLKTVFRKFWLSVMNCVL